MKVAVLIVHGIGKQKENFAQGLCKQLDKNLANLGSTSEVRYYPFAWQHLISNKEEATYAKARHLNFNFLRRFTMTHICDIIAYQRQRSNNLYAQIHEELDTKLREIGEWLGPDGKLIILSHSLGTIIVSNFIWDTQNKNSEGNMFHMATVSALDTLDRLQVLYTLGSPILLWSLSYENGGLPIRVPKWVNIHSPNDLIAYPIKCINEHYECNHCIIDIKMHVGGLLSRWNPTCHGAYFDSKKIIKMVADDIVV